MNKHLTDGQLRASLDGELDSDGLTHLETCSYCQTRQAALQTQTQAITDKLSFLSSPTEFLVPFQTICHSFCLASLQSTKAYTKGDIHV
ncbi:MAG: hypothetical protein QM730_25605 [Anaerolineales bacterium]